MDFAQVGSLWHGGGGEGTVIGNDASRARAGTVRFAGTTQRGVPVVALAGELDLVSHEAVVHRLGSFADRLGPDIVVDLTGVTFCDSRGLSALVRVGNRVRRNGGKLTLTGVPPHILRLFHMTRLTTRFQTTPHSVN